MSKQNKQPLLQRPAVVGVLASLLSIVIGLVLGFVLLVLLNPSASLGGMKAMLTTGFSNMDKLGKVLYQAAPLMMCGLSVGINVYKMRYAGVLISGLLGGIGGLAYTVAAGSGFNSDVGGYGFLALAVMIFGNWKPLPILGASLFFALFKVIAALNSTLSFLPKFEGVKEISNFYQMLPYIVTMIVLIFTSKNSQAPKAEGIPYDKGSR